MDVIKDFKRNIKIMSLTERRNPIVCVFVAMQIIIVTNLSYYIRQHWNNIDDIFVGLKALSMVFTNVGQTISFIFFWNDFSAMVDLFRNMHFKISYKMSSRRRQIHGELREELKRFNVIWWAIINNYILFTTIIPGVLLFVKCTLFSEDFYTLIKESSVSPFPLYYPESVKMLHESETFTNTLVYVTGYVLEAVFVVICADYAYLTLSAPLYGMTIVEYEFKLLTLSVMELDEYVEQSLESTNESTDDRPLNTALREFSIYFARHHQNNYRRYEIVNKAIRWIALIYCNIASLYICISIYTIVQNDSMIFKLQEAVFLLAWAMAMFGFCVCGERVKSESENLRNALYACTWLEKPEWFKKSLLIAMARASKLVEIRPFGLYCFNLNTFAKTINGAYCYYNLVCKFKS